MEDFYDIKASKTDAKRINVFGVFDGKEVPTFQTLHHYPLLFKL
jgi:hypothetical protein